MRLNKYQKEAIVRAIMADTPAPDRRSRRAITQAALTEAMSPECREVYRRTPGIFKESFAECLYDGEDYNSRHVVTGDAPSLTLRPLLDQFEAEDLARVRAQHQLRATIIGCSTLAQLKRLLPEFDRYYPTEQQPTKNLPALTNVVADLSKLGWPKK